jgi:uncharacterized protein YjbI with pentapeptide repeats
MNLDYKDFTNKKFLDVDITQSQISGSCFYQAEPYTKIFKDDLVCDFHNCNMDNVDLPQGCTISGTTCNRQIKWFDDEIWTVDREGNKIEKVN